MQRPTGVTILAVVSAIGGILGLLAGLALLGIGSLVAASGLGGFAAVAGLIVLAYAILSLVVAYGFWTLQTWAWPLGVAVEVLGIVQALLQWGNNGSGVGTAILSIAIAAFILWYLFQPHVRAAFSR